MREALVGARARGRWVCLLAGEAMAEPVKLAIIELLSGGQAAVGKMFLIVLN